MTGMKVLSGIVLALMLTGAVKAQEQGNDSRLGDRVLDAVSVSGQLWVLGSDGRLARIDLDRGELFPEGPNDAVAISSDRSHLVVARSGKGVINLTIKKETGDTSLPPLPVDRAQSIAAMAASPDGPVIITSEATFAWASERRKWRRLNYRVRSGFGAPHVVAAMLPERRVLLVGYNAGEWGGTLDVVQLDTGRTTTVRSGSPVTAIIADPNHAGCAIATEGLSHMGMTEGAIVRVCGRQAKVIYSNTQNAGFKTSKPFFGLTAAGKSAWAVSYNSLVRLDSDDRAQVSPLPKLERVGGVWLSRELPGLVVIRTDVNWMNSLSGYTPLIVAAP